MPTERARLVLAMLTCVLLISGCAQQVKPAESGMTPPSTETPEATPVTTKPELTLEEIKPAKEKEKIPEEFFPPLLSWRLFKGEKGDMFYPSFTPRKPEIKFKVNASLHFGFFVSTPLVEGDKVFLADDAGIYALDRKTGEFLWGVEILSDSLEGRKISYPQPWERWKALGTGKNVAAYGLGKYLFIGTAGGGKNLIIALDKNTGNVVWRTELEGEDDNLVTSNLLVADGKVCAGTVHSDARIYCFTENGKFLWKVKLEGNVRGITYGDGTLFVTSEPLKKLFALDANSGEIKWVYEHDSGVNTAAYARGKIFFTDSKGNVVALSKEGKLLWKKDVGAGSDVNTNSFLAVGNAIHVARTLGSRPLQLHTLDFNGKLIGNFTLMDGEYPGIPLATKDIVILPVKKDYEYAKIYLLWKGITKLYELVLRTDEVWTPKVSAAYGEIYIAVRTPDMVYRLLDEEKPVIMDMKTELLDNGIKVTAAVKDGRSAIYKALLVYSINSSKWAYREMEVSRRYVAEPVGGYGLTEESYETLIKTAPNSTFEFYIVAVDRVGNYEMSENKAYKLVYSSG